MSSQTVRAKPLGPIWWIMLARGFLRSPQLITVCVAGRRLSICCMTQELLIWQPSCAVGKAAPNVHLPTPKALLMAMLLLLFLVFRLGGSGGRLGTFRRMGT